MTTYSATRTLLYNHEICSRARFNVEIRKTNSLTLLIIQEVTNDSKLFLFCMVKGLQTNWTLKQSAIKSRYGTPDQASDLAKLQTAHRARPTNLNNREFTA